MAHRLVGPLAAAAVAAASLVLPVLPVPQAHATGLPPVTQPDAVTVTIDSREAHLDLAANDVDPDGDDVDYAGQYANELIPGVRIGRAGPHDVSVSAMSVPVRQEDSSGAVPGTYQTTMAVYDGSNIVTSTLTVTVLPSPGAAVGVTQGGRPGRVAVRNDSDTAVRFVWGAEGHRHSDGAVVLPPHSARKIDVRRRSVVTVVLAGTGYAIGVQRHLRPPRDGTALQPGVEPGHDHFSLAVGSTRWVQRAIGA